MTKKKANFEWNNTIQKLAKLRKPVVIENKTNSSIIDETFKELDEKLSIFNKETKDWLKQKILWHISESYERGKTNN